MLSYFPAIALTGVVVIFALGQRGLALIFLITLCWIDV
jgi:hypothetical protein